MFVVQQTSINPWTEQHQCLQMFNIPYTATHHQQQNSVPWQGTQQVFASIGGRSQSMHNPCIGTLVPPTNAYTTQVSYSAQQRESQNPNTATAPMLLPLHNRPQGGAYDSPTGHMPSTQYYTSGQQQSPGHESTQPPSRTQRRPVEDVEGEAVARVLAAMGHAISRQQRDSRPARAMSGGCVESSKAKGAESARPGPSTVGFEVVHPVGSTHTSSEGGALRNRRHSMKEPSPVNHTNNSPTLLSTTSSKSSPLSTLSQRKKT